MPQQNPWSPERIAALRRRLNATQLELANTLHVAPETVGRWERGRNRPSYHLARLLDSLDRRTPP